MPSLSRSRLRFTALCSGVLVNSREHSTIQVSNRLKSIALYKELHRLGRDHDPAYNFHGKLRSLFERNRSLSAPEDIERAFRLCDYIKRETLALYSLRKYRHLKRMYPPPPPPPTR